MRKIERYSVVKCWTDKTCAKCKSIADTIAVDKVTHITLYCSACGSFVKHANKEERKHLFVESIRVDDGTLLRVRDLYKESESTMVRCK